MKIAIVLLSLLLTQFTHATVLFCKQKVIPVKTEYTTTENEIVVKYTAERDISSFRISDIRGLDGLEVISKSDIPSQELKRGETATLTVTFEKPEGEVFLVTDIRATLNKKEKFQSLAIPVGKLSSTQILERKKNIKSLPSAVQQKTGTNALESETKYHVMKLPE